MNNGILKSFSWVVVANILTKPAWMLLIIVAARVLGAEQFGIYTYGLSIAVILNILVDYGYDYIAIREVSSDRSQLNSFFNKVFYVRIATFFLVIVLISIYFAFVNSFTKYEIFAIYILLVFQVTQLLLKYLKSLTTALHAFDLYSKMMIFEKLFISVLGFLSFLIEHDVIVFVLSLAIANTISVLLFVVVLNRKYDIAFQKVSFSEIMELVKKALPIFSMNIFIVIYFRVDVLILEYFSISKEIVGIYGSIHRIVEMYMLIPTTLMTIAYPIISRDYHRDKEKIISFSNRLLNVTMMITLPIVLIVTFNSYEINLMVFGEKYIVGYSGLQVIIWTIIPLGMNYVFGHLLISIDKQKECAKSVFVAAILNILLNILLIPKYSFVGASWVAVITEFLIMFFYVHFLLKYYGRVNVLSVFMKSGMILFVNYAVVHIYLNHFAYNMYVLSSVILLQTFLLFFVLGMIKLSEIKMVLQNEDRN